MVTATSKASDTTQKVTVDPRVMELVAAMVPGDGSGPFPSEDQKKAGEEVQKAVEAAVKGVQDKAGKGGDEEAEKEAARAFFAATVTGMAQQKKEAEEE